MFTLGEDEIEYGMGLHGEPGIKRAKMCSADELTENLFKEIRNDMKLKQGDEVCVLINGLGSTTNMEMCIVYRKLRSLLDEMGVSVYDSDINSYCTCQEMAGFSITLMRLDEELKRLYDKPCACPYYAKGVM